MIYNLKKKGKDIFILTPYKIDIDKIDVEKEVKIVRIVIINYTQVAMALLTTMALQVIVIVNAWSDSISIALTVIFLFAVLLQFFITQKRINSIVG